jgi:UDP-3-O-[3-hydroxymyristoyl] N-acetylglucosamine deacetylase
MLWQKTLARPLNFTGIGLHTGQPVQVTVQPAGANYGLRFVRTDLPHRPEILAHYTRVVDTTASRWRARNCPSWTAAPRRSPVS